MDMSVTTVCSSPSLTQRLVILFIIFYPMGILISSIGRRGRAPLSFVTVPLALAPIFAGMAGAWSSLARVYNSLPITFSGRAARAAGVAEAQVTLTFGASVALLLSAIALLRALSYRRVVSTQGNPSYVLSQCILALGALGVLAAELLASITLVHSSVGFSRASVSYSLVLAAFASIAALVSVVLVIHARRQDLALCKEPGIVVAATMTIVSLVVCIAGWRLADHFIRIAMFG
jgi:hypothetical protein